MRKLRITLEVVEVNDNDTDSWEVLCRQLGETNIDNGLPYYRIQPLTDLFMVSLEKLLKDLKNKMPVEHNKTGDEELRIKLDGEPGGATPLRNKGGELMPREEWDIQRFNDVCEAIAGRISDSKRIDPEWLREYDEFVQYENAKRFTESFLDIQNDINISEELKKEISVDNRKAYIRKQAIDCIELTKGFEHPPTDNAMKTALEFADYILELTNPSGITM